MNASNRLASAVATILACGGSAAFASDMPSIPDATWKAVLILSCIPALLVVPLFVIRAVFVWIYARDSANPPNRTRSRWWLAALIASLIPWAITVPWVLLEFASISS